MKLFASFLLAGMLAVGCNGQSVPITSSTSVNAITAASNGWVTSTGTGSALAPADGAGVSLTCDSMHRCWVTNATVWGTGGGVWSIPGAHKPKPKYTLAQVRASAVPIPKAKLAPAAYLTLAKSIGLESAGTDEARMLDCLDKLALKPYDPDKVDAYLTHKAEAQGPNVIWVWKPLRESDENVVKMPDPRHAQPFAITTVFQNRYGHAVPAHALSVAAEVLREMPDAVFLVSDYEAVKPDPFLAVTTARLLGEGRVWIIDVWEEPGFGAPDVHFGPAEAAPTRLTTD